MFHHHRFSFQSCLFLSFLSVSFAAVTPNKHPQYSQKKLHLISPNFLSHFNVSHPILPSLHQHTTQLHPSSRQSGLEFDSCQTSSDCAGLRICSTISDGGGTVICQSGIGCYCQGIGGSSCASDSDCNVGERCIKISESNFGCFSDTAGSTSRGDQSFPGPGLNFDSCTTDSDCDLPRQCLQAEDGIQPCTSTADVCRCISRNPGDLFCTSDANCAPGETCIPHESTNICVSNNSLEQSNDSSNGNVSDDGNGFESSSDEDVSESSNDDDASEASSDNGNGEGSSDGGENADSSNANDSNEFEPQIEDTSASVCIDIDSLTHLARNELTFEHDALAHVFCDANESCATPGHMVVYNGNALMMKSYCKLVGCTRKVKRVNSPKYVRRLTVPSQTRGLVFTVFAARFETAAEEVVLSSAVRFGF